MGNDIMNDGPECGSTCHAPLDFWDALHIDASKYEDIEPLRKTA
jgi:hypothetical protein